MFVYVCLMTHGPASELFDDFPSVVTCLIESSDIFRAGHLGHAVLQCR